jgi:hypothetical protein
MATRIILAAAIAAKHEIRGILRDTNRTARNQCEAHTGQWSGNRHNRRKCGYSSSECISSLRKVERTMARLAKGIPEAGTQIEFDFGRADPAAASFPQRAAAYPELRYMGSKHRLLPWIHSVLRGLSFETAADPFVGSGCVAYLLKSMGKTVVASDFLNFPVVLASATVANSTHRLDSAAVKQLMAPHGRGPRFVEKTFTGIFYTPEDLRFLDRVSANVDELKNSHHQALARAALIRSCLKKQPRGVFTVSGDLSHYDDGRRDLTA